MTFKQFAYALYTLPAKIFAGIVSLVLGDFARRNDGAAVKGEGFRGLLGLILDGVKYLGKSVTNFLQDHKKAIAAAFWGSLLVAGAAVLTVAFWPAALAAVTGFSVYGVSIASLVGTGFAAQLAGVAAAATVLTSALVYTTATVVNTFNAIKNFFTGTKASMPSAQSDAYQPEALEKDSASKLSVLSSVRPVAPSAEVASAPASSAALFVVPKPAAAQPVLENTAALANK